MSFCIDLRYPESNSSHVGGDLRSPARRLATRQPQSPRVEQEALLSSGQHAQAVRQGPAGGRAQEGALVVGRDGRRHLVGAGGQAGRRGEGVAVQAVGRRVEAEPGVARRGGVGQVAQLGGGERQRAESFAVVQRRAPGGRERIRPVAVAVEGQPRAAGAVVGRAEGAHLEGRGARRRGEQVGRRSDRRSVSSVHSFSEREKRRKKKAEAV